ncbi:MAG: DUF2807 domain-containing protein [Chitinophagaceae bacterium]|nr:DUF2807 domain-containing protein [Chitinophagaceae bacterium]
MNRIFFLAVILSFASLHSNAQLASAKKNYIVGVSNSVSSLRIDGNINVTLVIAPNEPNVYIEGGEKFTKNVKASIVDGAMIINASTSSKSENDVVIIYAPGISELELNGDIKLKTIGTINAENLQLSINGNCRLRLQHTGKMNIRLDDNYELTEKEIMRVKPN